MLTINNINDFLDRIRVEDMNYSVVKRDSFGDLIEVFDPDTDYHEVVNKAINNSRCMRNKVVDSGVNYTEMVDDVYINGNRVNVDILCETGDSGFGTKIKFMVKRIDIPINGEMKSFLGFESLKNYQSNIVANN